MVGAGGYDTDDAKGPDAENPTNSEASGSSLASDPRLRIEERHHAMASMPYPALTQEDEALRRAILMDQGAAPSLADEAFEELLAAHQLTTEELEKLISLAGRNYGPRFLSEAYSADGVAD